MCKGGEGYLPIRYIISQGYRQGSFPLPPLLTVPLIRPQRPIQQPNPSKIHIKPLMVAIMLPRGPAKEVVPAMHRRSLYKLHGQKRPHGQDVRAEEHRRDQDGQDVCGNVLDGMGVLRGECDGGGEAVVRLVEAAV